MEHLDDGLCENKVHIKFIVTVMALHVSVISCEPYISWSLFTLCYHTSTINYTDNNILVSLVFLAMCTSSSIKIQDDRTICVVAYIMPSH